MFAAAANDVFVSEREAMPPDDCNKPVSKVPAVSATLARLKAGGDAPAACLIVMHQLCCRRQ
jgi:hypothetical protein